MKNKKWVNPKPFKILKLIISVLQLKFPNFLGIYSVHLNLSQSKEETTRNGCKQQNNPESFQQIR